MVSICLSSCADGRAGPLWEAMLSPDENLSQSPVVVSKTTEKDVSKECSESILSLFPNEFPNTLCYPNSLLLSVERLKSASPKPQDINGNSSSNSSSNSLSEGEIVQAKWQTSQSLETVQKFYQNFFDVNEWSVTRLPNDLANAGILQAVNGGSRVTIRFSNFADLRSTSPEPAELITITKDQPLEYTLAYRNSVRVQRDANTTEISTDNTDVTFNPQASLSGDIPEEKRKNAIKEPEAPIVQAGSGNHIETNLVTPDVSVNNLNDIPSELWLYVEDFLELEIEEGKVNEILRVRPNEPITRRDFARWLFLTNNLMYDNRPTQHIRLGSISSELAFQDISIDDPDFEIIQGLAEAGLIPSHLVDEATDGIRFEPDAPLTRETLIAWKTPLDRHPFLADADIKSIEESWGFQDADQISDMALSTVFADFQNDDQSNIRRAFGYTRLFQPQKVVTHAEAIAVLSYFGTQESGISVSERLEQQTVESQPSLDPEALSPEASGTP